ncbi:MAG TPA: dienelactone hydrolase family protein [Longimicrobiales bacterium]|nr:dienelactone hydrolase family protein [Longimicrobiales bacterium]
MRTATAAAVALFAAACSSTSVRQVTVAGAGTTPATPAASEAAMAGAPTKPGELPAAILGTAPPPRGESVAYFPGDPAAHGYFVAPKGGGPASGVILIHEWNGLNDRVRQVADALAAEGYAVLAADVFSGRTGSNPQENIALVRQALGDSAKLIQNLDAAARFLRARPGATGRVATIGWCFGGGVALSYGVGGEHHEGTAMFYGRLLMDPQVLARMHHPLYGSFAAQDQGIPPDSVRRFVDALRQAGIDNDVHVYDDVGHGFWLYVDQDPAKRTAPALDAWQRLKSYLARTLRA